MERTVPSTASEEVDLYQRTYYSLLRSTSDVQILSLEEAHAGMKSLLHPNARESGPDIASFLYSLLRFPGCIHQVKLVVLGQSQEVFSKAGFNNIDRWDSVSAIARRRRCFFEGVDTLAFCIASASDIDDVIPILTAYQIEWNKLHTLLKRDFKINSQEILSRTLQEAELREVASVLTIPVDDIERLKLVWGKDFEKNLHQIATTPRKLKVKLLNGSLVEYRRATNIWWERIAQGWKEIIHR